MIRLKEYYHVVILILGVVTAIAYAWTTLEAHLLARINAATNGLFP
jgi:hypothetical protein